MSSGHVATSPQADMRFPLRELDTSSIHRVPSGLFDDAKKASRTTPSTSRRALTTPRSLRTKTLPSTPSRDLWLSPSKRQALREDGVLGSRVSLAKPSSEQQTRKPQTPVRSFYIDDGDFSGAEDPPFVDAPVRRTLFPDTEQPPPAPSTTVKEKPFHRSLLDAFTSGTNSQTPFSSQLECTLTYEAEVENTLVASPIRESVKTPRASITRAGKAPSSIQLPHTVVTPKAPQPSKSAKKASTKPLKGGDSQSSDTSSSGLAPSPVIESTSPNRRASSRRTVSDPVTSSSSKQQTKSGHTKEQRGVYDVRLVPTTYSSVRNVPIDHTAITEDAIAVNASAATSSLLAPVALSKHYPFAFEPESLEKGSESDGEGGEDKENQAPLQLEEDEDKENALGAGKALLPSSGSRPSMKRKERSAPSVPLTLGILIEEDLAPTPKKARASLGARTPVQIRRERQIAKAVMEAEADLGA